MNGTSKMGLRYSISNIAWDKEHDAEMYTFLKENGIQGLEMAPTRLFDDPYDNLERSHLYARMLKNRYSLEVSSMQSIWYRVSESIFGSQQEREKLLRYTRKAILFAESMGIGNMVFGCPKNRRIPEGMSEKEAEEIAVGFFRRLGDFAAEHNTVLAMEANPVIYGTNFLNGTRETCEFVKKVGSSGLKVNIDMRTMIYNKENPHLVKTYKTLVNHIHISFPNLLPIEECEEYRTLKKVLGKIDYTGYISVEMKNSGDIQKAKDAILFVKEFFNGIS